MTARLVANGRFLRARATGLHHAGRALLTAARAAGLDFEVIAPSGVDDPLVDRILPAPPGRGSDHLWEQFVLPATVGARPVLSVANTAPIAARHGTVWLHDLAPLVGPQWFNPRMRVYGRLVFAALQRAERVLTTSRQVSDELVERGIRAPISVLRQALDADLAPSPPEVVAQMRRRLGVTGDYLLLIGWADPRKDAGTALAAHLRAYRERPHSLVLVGLAHPVFRALRLPEVPSVIQTGYVDGETLRALLTGAAALLYPSRYEGFGRPPLEAWRCGTPALVSDLPAIREATLDRAVYLPPGEVDAWTSAILDALDGRWPVPEPDPWTWDDAARQLIAALG